MYKKKISIKHENRNKQKEPTKDKFWCPNCDMALVGEYGKCPNCGKKINKGKYKL